MKTKFGYLTFLKWKGNQAIFRESTLSEILLFYAGAYAIGTAFGIKECNTILIKCAGLPDIQRKVK